MKKHLNADFYNELFNNLNDDIAINVACQLFMYDTIVKNNSLSVLTLIIELAKHVEATGNSIISKNELVDIINSM